MECCTALTCAMSFKRVGISVRKFAEDPALSSSIIARSLHYTRSTAPLGLRRSQSKTQILPSEFEQYREPSLEPLSITDWTPGLITPCILFGEQTTASPPHADSQLSRTLAGTTSEQQQQQQANKKAAMARLQMKHGNHCLTQKSWSRATELIGTCPVNHDKGRRPDCAGPVWMHCNASTRKGVPPVKEQGMGQQAASERPSLNAHQPPSFMQLRAPASDIKALGQAAAREVLCPAPAAQGWSCEDLQDALARDWKHQGAGQALTGWGCTLVSLAFHRGMSTS